jgi:hypothetical protein
MGLFTSRSTRCAFCIEDSKPKVSEPADETRRKYHASFQCSQQRLKESSEETDENLTKCPKIIEEII